MRPWLSLLFAILALFPCLAFSQESTPDYQPTALREICKAGPVHDRPDGKVIGKAVKGQLIELADIDFGADGELYLIFGEKEERAAIAASRTAHFCEYVDRMKAVPTPFLAPPNSCHVIAASRRTLDEVNEFMTRHSEYAPVTNVFRAQNGWYAISLGLVSNKAALLMLDSGQNIPDDAYCSDGSNYFDVMERQDGRFVELDPPAPAEPADRRSETIALREEDRKQNDQRKLRRACHLGSASACGIYAHRLERAEPETDAKRQEMIRFYMYACMLGDPAGCNNLLVPSKGGVNKTLFTGFPDRIGAASAPPTLDLELAKIGCDAGLAPSCSELATPAIQYRSENRAEYLTSLQATYMACSSSLSAFYCRDFADRVDSRYTVMDKPWYSRAHHGLARVFAKVCRKQEAADNAYCRRAYYRYQRFLDSSSGDANQRAVAAQFIRGGCEKGSIVACAYQSRLDEQFQFAERRTAAAKVLAACDEDDETDKICDELDQRLGNDLPEAQGPIRAKYEELADECRTEKATSDSSNPCRRAFSYYAGRISSDDLSEPLGLLHETCRDDGKITGCAPLDGVYSGQEFLLADRSRKSWPEQPEKALAALKTGCIPTLEAVGNCGSLGIYYERQGNFAAAAEAYALGCETGMTAGEGDYFGQGRVCYWAAKNARDNLQDYANARKWFGYVCHVDEEPFACKFLGLMHAQGEGGEADPLTALDLYRLGCDMTEDIALGDGTSCYLYGQSLVEMRDEVARDRSHYGYIIAPPDYAPQDELIRMNLAEASRAFLRGCIDDRDVACRAHTALLEDWSAGAYPRREVECCIMDSEERMAPAKICERFPFYLAPPDGMGDRGSVNVFVWPDGDRTVTFDDYGNPTLNGSAGTWVLPEGGWECIQSSGSGRSFCTEPW